MPEIQIPLEVAAVALSHLRSAEDASEAADRQASTLLPSLRRLDELLERAVHRLNAESGGEMADRFRGLYVSPNDVSNMLVRDPGETRFGRLNDSAVDDDGRAVPSPLSWLRDIFGLTPFDIDVVLLAFAPELDLRYEKIYGYLQDDITRKRPTIDLALHLFCASPAERLARRQHFTPEAPLIEHGVISLSSDPNDTRPSFLSLDLRLDVEIGRMLVGDLALHPSLMRFCCLVQPVLEPDSPLPDDALRPLRRLAEQALATKLPFRVYFQCANEAESRTAAEALAASLERDLVVVRLDWIPESADLDEHLKLCLRTARIRDAFLALFGLDDLRGLDGVGRRQAVLRALASHGGVAILTGRQRWAPDAAVPLGIIPIVIDVPGVAARSAIWKARVANCGFELEPAALNFLAGRFALTPNQIDDAVMTAVACAQWRTARIAADSGALDDWIPQRPLPEDLASAARSQCGHELSKLARKIEPRYGWSDIVLPPDGVRQLHEICELVASRQVVFGEWGFDRKLRKGINVLFYGPPGTGKTMGAEVIANELQLDLYRIDLSQIVSKYIGDTEKNLDRIFAAAENSNAILFFDEADALFGKRSEVRDAHDRFANIEISYLLQKMEEYQGISVLATNLRQNLDDAFVRRLQVIVEFSFPDEDHRFRIWKQVFPDEAPIGEDARFEILAREVRLAGGNIRNVALAAAAYAAVDGGVIHMEHLVRAAHREHQKMGRSWDSALAVEHGASQPRSGP